MNDPMLTSAGTFSFYLRLREYVDLIKPIFFPSRKKAQMIRHTIDWLNIELLPHPHRDREIAALKHRHHITGSPDALVSEVICEALQLL